MKISAIVMASGLSRRMGTNKLLMKLGSKKIYTYVLDTIYKADLDEVILVTPYKEIQAYGRGLAYKVIDNKESFIGQSESIRLGVNNAKRKNAYMFFVADQPLISLETIEILVQNFNKNPIATYPTYKQNKGNPVIFPNSYRQGLLELKNDQGGKSLLTNQKTQNIEIEKKRELLDIDTIGDYKELVEIYDK